MTIESELSKAANNLQLKEERHAAFARLALHHLRHTRPEHSELDRKSRATISFMRAHGLQIWPSFKGTRGHLTVASTVSTGKNRGISYPLASQLKAADLKAWKVAHEGREPNAEEALIGSPLGRLLLAYFECLMDVDESGNMKLGDASTAEASEQELLSAVIGEQSDEKKTLGEK